MALVGYHLSGKQPAGTDATSANSGLGSFTLNGGTAKWTSPTNDAINFTSPAAAQTLVRTNTTSATQYSYRVKFRVNSVPTAAANIFAPRWASGRAAGFTMDTNTTTPRIFFTNSANGFGAVAWNITLGVVYELVWWLDVTAGTGKARLYLANGTPVAPAAAAAAYGSLSGNDINFSGYNFGTNTLTNFDMGAVVSTSVFSVDIHDVQVNDGSQAEIPTYVFTNAVPTASAGANKTVLPGATVGFSVTDSDSDGTVQSRLMSYVDSVPSGAPTPTINAATTASPTFTAPSGSAGTTYRCKYVVTDNAGAVSPDSFVYVFVPTKNAKAVALVGNTEYTLIGGGSTVANVNDGSDTTGVQYPAGSTVSKSVRYKLAPLEASTTNFTITIRRRVDTAGAGVSRVTIYEGANVRLQWTGVDVPTTSISPVVLNLANATVNNVGAVTNFNELEIEFNWGP